MLANSVHQQHRAASSILSDTPPELVSPSSSTYSTVPSEGYSTWRARSDGPLSPPMSHYDQQRLSVAKDMIGRDPVHRQPAHEESLLSQPDAMAGAARPQLPSLSSLFPLGQRTLPSPLSERTSYSATSPMDPPRSAGGMLERSGPSSYFPQAGPSGTAQQATRATFEPPRLDRTGPPSSSRPDFPGPLSPGLREPGHVQRGNPSSRWSFHQDMIRGGSELDGRGYPGAYSSRQLAGHKHDHEGHLSRASSDSKYPADPRATPQQHYQLPHHSSYASAPSAAHVAGEGMPTKDGLGPKIWTGAHFLPRFVRAAEIPGEGLCYFYDDGSHCKTVIDGEAVNAHWGVTKAGKPRKRLAIACVTCREKKIKCDPDYPRCVQCEKFGRVCKFKNA